jgi:hypothetical protein
MSAGHPPDTAPIRRVQAARICLAGVVSSRPVPSTRTACLTRRRDRASQAIDAQEFLVLCRRSGRYPRTARSAGAVVLRLNGHISPCWLEGMFPSPCLNLDSDLNESRHLMHELPVRLNRYVLARVIPVHSVTQTTLEAGCQVPCFVTFRTGYLPYHVCFVAQGTYPERAPSCCFGASMLPDGIYGRHQVGAQVGTVAPLVRVSCPSLATGYD